MILILKAFAFVGGTHAIVYTNYKKYSFLRSCPEARK